MRLKIVALLFPCFIACTPQLVEKPDTDDKEIDPEPGRKEVVEDQISQFYSSDPNLVDCFDWARHVALSYSHKGNDPVGLWYEAALPGRQAFCMRDVSHQCIGAQIIGLEKHNLNMMNLFAKNISDSKDWCSYWEIDRRNKPADADYANDKEFWYNLNANFDVIQACLKLYKWTGDKSYISDPTFLNFYEKSLSEYIVRWDLQPDKIMMRPRYMNSPYPFDPNNPFHGYRGLPSYVENMGGLISSADLISSIYAGYDACSEIYRINGDSSKSLLYRDLALQYKTLLNTDWWENRMNSFYSVKTDDGKFYRGEGISYIIWFDATDIPKRIDATIKRILSKEWNEETTSYFPVMLYRYNYNADAYKFLLRLPKMPRATYPEVSYGVVEGFIGGMMGIEPNAEKKMVTTCSKLPPKTGWAKIENIPIFDGYISVKHKSTTSTQFFNNTPNQITWRVTFEGTHEKIKTGSTELLATTFTDILGNSFSYADVLLDPYVTLTAKL